MSFLKTMGAFLGALVITAIAATLVFTFSVLAAVLPYIIIMVVVIGLVFVGIYELLEPKSKKSVAGKSTEKERG